MRVRFRALANNEISIGSQFLTLYETKKLFVFNTSQKLGVFIRWILPTTTKTRALFSIELLPCMEKSEAQVVLLVVHTLSDNS